MAPPGRVTWITDASAPRVLSSAWRASTPRRTATPGKVLHVRLEVYVDDECMACSRSRSVASEVRLAHPDVEVAILAPHDNRAQHPHLVAAVPTYILDGRVVSLGNPRFEDLDAAIRARASEVQ